MLCSPPLTLYLHYPFCPRKCPYCDFNSHQSDGNSQHDYIDALLKDLHSSIDAQRELTSIFIGGGTPSLLAPEQLVRIFEYLAQQFDLTKIEITLEANPGASDVQRFQAYRALGVNRLSLGVQSFNQQMLTKLGRIHTTDDIFVAYDAARHVGFDNINLDLMYGLPEQTLDQIMDDLNQTIRLNPTHISWYQLTIEPNTFLPSIRRSYRHNIRFMTLRSSAEIY